MVNPVKITREWLLRTFISEGYHMLIYIFVVFCCWALYCTALAGMRYFQTGID